MKSERMNTMAEKGLSDGNIDSTQKWGICERRSFLPVEFIYRLHYNPVVLDSPPTSINANGHCTAP